MSIRASSWPALTVSPSRTVSSRTSPGTLALTVAWLQRLHRPGHRQPARERLRLDAGEVGLRELERRRRLALARRPARPFSPRAARPLPPTAPTTTRTANPATTRRRVKTFCMESPIAAGRRSRGACLPVSSSRDAARGRPRSSSGGRPPRSALDADEPPRRIRGAKLTFAAPRAKARATGRRRR